MLGAALAAPFMAAPLASCGRNPESGRRQLAFVPDAMLAQMADESWNALKAQTPLSNDAALQSRLARVAGPLVAATGRSDLAWEFQVFDSPELNAFVLPNGKVAVLRGMMEFAARDDELAAVVGHELAHVLARHAAERVSQEMALQAGVSVATSVLSGENGENADLISGALGLGATLGVLLPYSRTHELEADRIGVTLMRRAGVDAGAAVEFWERMAANSARGGAPIEVLSTHPADGRRLEELRRAVAAPSV